MGVARNKTPGAQLHMMVNMPVKLNDSYTFDIMHYTKLHAECIILKCIRGHNSSSNGHGQKQNPRCTTTHDGQHTCKVL
jgi:hypothetical protein